MQQYKVTEPLEAIDACVTRLEALYQTEHDMAYGRGEPPVWDRHLGEFRAALDQIKAGVFHLSSVVGP